MEKTKLTIELVPQTCHYKNLRSDLPRSQWDLLRRDCYKKANYCCEVCGGKGFQHPVECHEIWDYNDKKHIQKLVGLISLCPACHEVKHIGLAQVRGNYDRALKHLMRINKWTEEDAEVYVEVAFETYMQRSLHEWKSDISIVEKMLEEIKNEK